MSAHIPSRHSLRLGVSPDPAEPETPDRRAHHRLTLAELPWLREIRLKYGPRAVLIDMSVGGAQLEAADYQLRPGSSVVVEIAGDTGESPIPSRVVRSQVVGLAPQPIYRAALEFERTLAMPHMAVTAPPGSDPNLLHEHARLLFALHRLDADVSGGTDDRLATAKSIEVMSAIVEMIGTPAARRAGRTFTRELATLFSIVTNGIEEDAPEDALIARLVERLRRRIPVRAVRVSSTLPVTRSDVIYFDVPQDGNDAAAKLVVELPTNFRFEEWQFHYLKAAAHFFALVRAIAARRAAQPPIA